MRPSLLNVIVALLIAVLAIGAPIPAKADCAGHGRCNVGAVDATGGSCGEKSETCKIAQSCAVQLFKMPGQTMVSPVVDASRMIFAMPVDETLASASVTPEIAPPRV